MRRLLLVAFVTTLLLVPAAAQGGSGSKLRGTVTEKNAAAGLVTVTSKRREHVLKVPGTLSAVRIGQRVELRNTTLRSHGNGSRVLAHGVVIVGAQKGDHAVRDDDDEPDDDERELRGRITSLSPLTVAGLTCTVPSRISLSRFHVGDVVEITCDRIGGVWTLRKIQLEDDDEIKDEDERDGDNNDHDDGDDDDNDDGDRDD